MNDVEFVHVLDALNDLSEEFTGFAFLEAFLFDNLFEKLAFRDELHDEEELLWGFDDFIELNEIGVADLFEDMYFAGDTFYISNIDDFIFFEYFDGDFFA